MAIPVLIIGESGAGKSSSLRTCVDQGFGLVSVLGKPLPFRGHIPTLVSDNYQAITGAIVNGKTLSMVIDDAGCLISNDFMRQHSKPATNKYDMYNDLADNYWRLIDTVRKIQDPNKLVYFFMHEDASDGVVKPLTIGKLLSEKAYIPAYFSIVIRAVVNENRHSFVVRDPSGASVVKTPFEMFETDEIDNDLRLVDDTIRAYYGLAPRLAAKKKKEA